MSLKVPNVAADTISHRRQNGPRSLNPRSRRSSKNISQKLSDINRQCESEEIEEDDILGAPKQIDPINEQSPPR